jgi:hypothetical protein
MSAIGPQLGPYRTETHRRSLISGLWPLTDSHFRGANHFS